MQTLLIRSRVDAAEQQWYEQAAGGALKAIPASTAAAGALRRSGKVIWLIRTQDLSLHTKPVPARRSADLKRAIPYAFEDDLAVQQLETCAFAVAHAGEGDQVTVAVVDKRKLQSGFKCLSEAGVSVQRVVPDVLALDWQQGTWSVLIDGGIALVRTGLLQGYAVEPTNLAWALRQSLSNTPEPDRPTGIRIWGGSLEGAELEVPLEFLPGSAEQVLHRGIRELPPLNLLAEASTDTQLNSAQWRYLKLAAALAFATLLLAWGNAWWQLQQLQGYEQRLEQGIAGIFRRSLPQVKRMVNPRVQLDQEIQRLRSQHSRANGMLSQLADLSAILAQNKGLALKNLNFQSGVFLLTLNAKSVQQLDAIKSGIERAQRYQATIESVKKEKHHVVGTIRVRERA